MVTGERSVEEVVRRKRLPVKKSRITGRKDSQRHTVCDVQQEAQLSVCLCRSDSDTLWPAIVTHTMSARKKQRTSGTPQKQEDDSGLPEEVIRVAQRIGLKQNVSINDIRQFVKDAIGEEEYEKLKYQTYNLRQIQSKILRYSQKIRQVTRKKKVNVLNSKERKKLFDVSGSKELRYDTFIGLNQLWQQYMTTIIGSDPNKKIDESKILKCDLHGARIIVSAARNPDFVNVDGIVVQETRNMIRMITSEDRVVSVPKIGSIFAFLVNKTLFKVNGTYFGLTPHQRSKLKLKVKRKNDTV